MELIEPPSPEGIEASRARAGLTASQAGRLMGQNYRRWNEYATGAKRPDRHWWSLWLLLTDQHPTHRLSKRRKATLP